MPQQPLPLVNAHHPNTFLERGVAVPFTTPALLAARVRPADRRGIELVVPNPSGGRGVYILPWLGVCQLCHPTVHDTKLYQRIADHRGITPGSIRAAALTVAAEGLAGHAAAEAARTAAARQMHDRLATNFLLMVATVRQTDPTGIVDELEVIARHPSLQRRAKRGLQQIAPRLGRETAKVFSDLEELAGVLTPIGLEGQDPPARAPKLLAAIARFQAQAMLWARENTDDSGAQAALAAKAAAVTITCAQITLAQARASTDSIFNLLTEWIADSEMVAARLARTEWLVDGWEQICALWESSPSRAERRIALTEIPLMVPILPNEVAAWLDRVVDTDVTRGHTKIVPAHIDWRTGAYFDRVARNEHLRVFAA